MDKFQMLYIFICSVLLAAFSMYEFGVWVLDVPKYLKSIAKELKRMNDLKENNNG